MKLLISGICLFYIISSITGCDNACVEPFSTRYVFEIPVSLTPAQDTFQIGDTITIESVFSDQVLERNLQQRFPLINWKFYPGTTIDKIDSNPAAKDALFLFDLLLSEAADYKLHQFSDNSTKIYGQYQYDNNTYFLKFGLIPRVPGLYLLSQVSSLYPINEWQDFPGKCKNTSSEAFVSMNNGTSTNNIHYLSLSPDPYYNDWILIKPEQRFHRGGGYCFVVVE